MTTYLSLCDLPTISVGLNIEGMRPTLTLPNGCVWYNIIQAIDEPLNGVTFDNIMEKKRKYGFDLIEQTVDNIDIEKFITTLVNLINKIKVNHKKLLVHIHQYTGTTILNKILHERTGATVILDQTNFFESPINYCDEHGDIDGLFSISQCAGIGTSAGTWIIPSGFLDFDVNSNTVSTNAKKCDNQIKKYVDSDFEYVEGNILVVNDLWNPKVETLDSQKVILV